MKQKILKIFLLIVSSILLVGLTSQAAGPGDWTMFQYDLAHTGYNPEETELRPPLRVAWRFNPGQRGVSTIGPVTDGDRVYVSSTNLYALDAITGAPVWSLSFPHYDEILATDSLTLDEQTIYAVTDDGILYAVDASDGSIRWTFWEEESTVLSNGAPLVVDGVIYWSTSKGHVFAVNREGEQLWRFDTPEWTTDPTYGEGLIFVGSDDGLYALDAQTGELRWHFVGDDVCGTAYAEGTVYASSEDSRLYALEAATGQERWHFRTGESLLQPPALAYGMVYVPSSDGHLYAVDAQTGKMVWRQDVPMAISYMPVAVANGYVYLAKSRDLWVFDAQTGDVAQVLELYPKAMGPMAISGGRLYVGVGGGNVYALEYDPEGKLAPPIPAANVRERKRLIIISLAAIGAILIGLIVRRLKRKK